MSRQLLELVLLHPDPPQEALLAHLPAVQDRWGRAGRQEGPGSLSGSTLCAPAVQAAAAATHLPCLPLSASLRLVSSLCRLSLAATCKPLYQASGSWYEGISINVRLGAATLYNWRSYAPAIAVPAGGCRLAAAASHLHPEQLAEPGSQPHADGGRWQLAALSAAHWPDVASLGLLWSRWQWAASARLLTCAAPAR